MNSAHGHKLDRLCARLSRADGAYDDLSRARAEGRLRESLSAMAKPRRSIRAFASVAAVALSIAAAVFFVLRPRPPWRPAAGVAATAPAPILRPYLVAPSGPARTEPAPALADASSLQIPAGWLVRSSVGDGITIGLEGPARLSVGGTANDLELRLDGGRLLVDVTPGRGTHLRVLTAGVDLTVVGTLFEVDASGVGVRHGRVLARPRGGGTVAPVEAGQRWHARARAIEPLDSETAGALDAQHAAPAPQAGAVMIAVTGEPAGAEIWHDGHRVAITPAWIRLPAGAELSVAAPGRARTRLVVPATRATLGYRLAPNRVPSRANAGARDVSPRVGSAQPVSDASTEHPSRRELYRLADRALAAGDRDGARMALLTVLQQCGDDALADAARIDLATLALDAGELEAAGRYLDEIRGSAVAAPAAHLRCRVALAALPAAEREVARARFEDCAGLQGLPP